MARRRKERPPARPRAVDDDGWPIEDGQAREAAVAANRLRSQQLFLDTCERAVMDDRYFPAAVDAIEFCVDHRLPLPEWLGRLILAILTPSLSRKHEATTNRREKHWIRWDAVRDLLDRRDELGETRDTAPVTAGEYLGENDHTVSYSFRKVEKALKSGEPGRVYVARTRVKKRAKKR